MMPSFRRWRARLYWRLRALGLWRWMPWPERRSALLLAGLPLVLAAATALLVVGDAPAPRQGAPTGAAGAACRPPPASPSLPR